MCNENRHVKFAFGSGRKFLAELCHLDLENFQ